jgi:type VI secretion system protein ImpH
MADTDRRTVDSLKYLELNAPRFDFFDAVRVLELLDEYRKQVGYDSDPVDEAVRFRTSTSMGFPPSAIQEIASGTGENSTQVLMTVLFMGLYGRQGALPWHYTNRIVDEEKKGNTVLRSFFDIFNHRLLSLFYRAGIKYRYPLVYRKKGSDLLSKQLLAFTGISIRGTDGNLPFPDISLVKYGGLFNQSHSASSLASLLSDFFHCRIKVEQLVGEWLEISADDHNCIGRFGKCNSLGKSFTIGRRIFSRQHRFRISIDHLNFNEYKTFLPGGEKFKQLVSLTYYFCGASFSFDVRIEAESVPGMILGNREMALGRSLWLKSRNSCRDNQKPVFKSDDDEPVRAAENQ